MGCGEADGDINGQTWLGLVLLAMVFYPQIAWFHISHIQCNLKEITETNPAY